MRECPVVCFVYFPRNGSAPRVLKVGTPKYTQRRERKRCPWTEQEDQQLQTLHELYRDNWFEISKHMNMRTPMSCKERYQQLHPPLEDGVLPSHQIDHLMN